MKRIKWKDTEGWIHCNLVRDQDPDSSAPKGIPCSPPDINRIDWDGVKRDLNNLLVERDLITMADIRFKLEQLRSCVQDVLYERLIAIYTTLPEEDQNG